MRGSMVLFRPGGISNSPEVHSFDRAPTLDELQAAVGGDIEKVPGFGSIGYGGTVLDCVALCNEHGKLNRLPVNQSATIAWEEAVRRRGKTLRNSDGEFTKYLVGPVIVLFGDRAFMGSL
jgi:hypothetical protein